MLRVKVTVRIDIRVKVRMRLDEGYCHSGKRIREFSVKGIFCY